MLFSLERMSRFEESTGRNALLVFLTLQQQSNISYDRSRCSRTQHFWKR
jgi:hypothetical protein